MKTTGRVAAALALVALVHAHGMAQPAPPAIPSLRLLHWNSHHGGRRTDGVHDPAGFVAWIARSAPDVVTLNEVDGASHASALLAAFESLMPDVRWASHYARGNLIVSRLPIEAASDCMVNAGANRRAAHVSMRVGGQRVNVWNAHLALESSRVRTAETRAIQACESRWPESRIVAGDFNMPPGSEEYRSMTAGHVDAWPAAAALGTAVNYPGNCDGCTRNTRIDYVFTSKGARLTLASTEVLDTRDEKGAMASDHKPLLVVYQLPAPDPPLPVQRFEPLR